MHILDRIARHPLCSEYTLSVNIEDEATLDKDLEIDLSILKRSTSKIVGTLNYVSFYNHSERISSIDSKDSKVVDFLKSVIALIDENYNK